MTRARSGTRLVYVLCPGSSEHAGGIGRFVGNLMAEMGRADPTVRIVPINTRGDGHLALAPFFFMAALARIGWAAAVGARPVLHVNLASRGSALRKYVVVALGSALRLPVILHLHGAKFETFHAELRPRLQGALRTMFRRAERVVVLGPSWKRFAQAALGVPAARIDIVPNGVQTPSQGRVRVDELRSPAHIVFLGRLGARKGVPELIAALACPSLRPLPWRATLAGDGDITPFESQAASLGLAGRISFPGWLDREASASLLRTATLLVLPSRAEGLPLAVLEALAHGVPVIATPVGAIPDFLTNEVSALLVPPGDPAALARALARLIQSTDLRRLLSQRGADVFERNFDIGDIARRFAGFYAAAGSRAPIGVANQHQST